MTTLLPIAIVIGVPALVVAIASLVNRPLKLRLKKAKTIVRQRLNERDDAQADELLAAFRAPERELAWSLITAVATALKVSPGKLRPDDKLKDVLSVRFEEGSTLQAYTFHVLPVLERQVSTRAWKAVQKCLAPPPTSEDMWIDALFDLRLTELVTLMAIASEEHSR